MYLDSDSVAAVDVEKPSFTFTEYEKLALQTVAPITDEMRDRININGLDLRGVLETLVSLGNDIDQMKKHIFYGKLPDNGIQFSLNDEYAKRTQDGPRIENLSDSQIDLLHAVFGIIGEGCEIVHNILNPEMLQDPYQKGGVVEEVGDTLWYLPLALRAVLVTTPTSTNLEDAARANIRKLLTGKNARYASGSFSQGEAIHRDYAKENVELRNRDSETILPTDTGEIPTDLLQ